MNYGDLHDYSTGTFLRAASRAEALLDGGSGVILIDDDGLIVRPDDSGSGDARRVYVQE